MYRSLSSTFLAAFVLASFAPKRALAAGEVVNNVAITSIAANPYGADGFTLSFNSTVCGGRIDIYRANVGSDTMTNRLFQVALAAYLAKVPIYAYDTASPGTQANCWNVTQLATR